MEQNNLNKLKIWTKEKILELNKNLHWNFKWLEDEEVIAVIDRLKKKEWRFVGGCVRDSLLDIHTYDIDINTPLKPEEIVEIFKDFNISEIGKTHGTIMIFCKNYKFEITTLRKDVVTDGRKAIVSFESNWELDSNRRDFTINSLMLKVDTMEVYDYNNGIPDLNNRIVKFIGNDSNRIQEDYLRILRFIRFSIRFSKKNDREILTQLNRMINSIDGLKKVSIERITQELLLILNHKNWQIGIEMIKYLKIDEKILNIDLNDNFENLNSNGIIINSLNEKLTVILMKKNKNLNHLSLPNHSRKIFIQIKSAIEILKNFHGEEIFNIFTMNSESLNLLKITIMIRDDIDNKFQTLKLIDKIITLQNNNNFKEKFIGEKEKIIKEYPQGKIIGSKIKESFYQLFKQY